MVAAAEGCERVTNYLLGVWAARRLDGNEGMLMLCWRTPQGDWFTDMVHHLDGSEMRRFGDTPKATDEPGVVAECDRANGAVFEEHDHRTMRIDVRSCGRDEGLVAVNRALTFMRGDLPPGAV